MQNATRTWQDTNNADVKYAFKQDINQWEVETVAKLAAPGDGLPVYPRRCPIGEPQPPPHMLGGKMHLAPPQQPCRADDTTSQRPQCRPISKRRLITRPVDAQRADRTDDSACALARVFTGDHGVHLARLTHVLLRYSSSGQGTRPGSAGGHQPKGPSARGVAETVIRRAATGSLAAADAG